MYVKKKKMSSNRLGTTTLSYSLTDTYLLENELWFLNRQEVAFLKEEGLQLPGDVQEALAAGLRVGPEFVLIDRIEVVLFDEWSQTILKNAKRDNGGIVKFTQLCSKFLPTALLNFACDG